MRYRSAALVLAGLAVAALPSGCGPAGEDQEPGAWASAAAPTAPATPPSPTPLTRTVTPAATAGPACRALTYEAVAAATGERFDVAASSGAVGSELVCVLQRADADLPDLTYVTITGAADTESFQLDYQPKNATAVSGLGKNAYRSIAASADAGRCLVEVGWLGKSAVYTLTLAIPGAPPKAQLDKAAAGLIALAKKLPG